MKPVFQKEPFNYQDGDCLSACLASILEIDLDEVPNFHKCYDFWQGLYDWLKSKQLSIDTFTLDNPDVIDHVEFKDRGKHCILAGPVGMMDEIQYPVYHAMVGEVKDKGIDIIHNPSGTGRTGFINYSPLYKPYVIFLKELNV